MNNLKDIIEALKLTRTETASKVSDEHIWDIASRIYISREIGEQKAKSETTQGEKKISQAHSSPLASNAQLEFLKNRQVKIKDGLTKAEAFIMISNYKKNLKKENI